MKQFENERKESQLKKSKILAIGMVALVVTMTALGVMTKNTSNSEPIANRKKEMVQTRPETSCNAGHQLVGGSCVVCGPGYSCAGGTSAAQKCPAGEFNPHHGQSTCQKTAAGHYTNAEGADAQLSCPPGTHQAATGATSCTECAPGSYNPHFGQAQCSTCTAGHYTEIAGSETQIACYAGQHQSATGKTSCTNCALGYYTPHMGQANCLVAAKGHYTDTTGSDAQIACPPGEYQDQTGKTSCTRCAPGKYNPHHGQANCLSAAVGHFTNMEGAEAQDPCPPGKYQGSAGQTSCTKCAPGTYTPHYGQGSCQNAAAGHYASGEGSMTQIACPPGSFQDEAGKTTCKPCPAGKWQPHYGQSSCLACASTDTRAACQESATAEIKNVCVTAAPNVTPNHGEVVVPTTGNLKGVTLKYVSGEWKSCGPNSAQNCRGRFGFPGWGFAVKITRSANPGSNVLYPQVGQTVNVQNSNTWNWNHYGIYTMSGKNPQTDAEMTLEEPQVAVTQGEKLRIYESEVLINNHWDGLGTVCYDVILLYV